MKNLLLILITGFFIIIADKSYSGNTQSNQVEEPINGQTLFIERSGEVSEVTDVLVNAYRKQHPSQQIVVSELPDEAIQGGIRIFTAGSPDGRPGGLSDKIAIANDIVVAVMSKNNPVAELLETRGIDISDFARLLSKNPEWENMETGADVVSPKVVISDNPQVEALLAGYAGLTSSEFGATRISGKEDFLSFIRREMNSIGFCRLTDVLNAEKTGFADNIKIIPVDKNRSGRIERFEQIYATPDELVRGVWVGKYPWKLSSKIYAAPVSGTYNEASVEFLSWVLNNGQENLASIGYSSLLTREVIAGMNILNPDPAVGSPASIPAGPGIWSIIILITGFLLLMYVVVRAFFNNQARLQSEDIALTPALNTASIKAPAGLFYDKTHTWTFMEQDGLVKVGINDFIQHITGPLSQVKMKPVGEKVRKGEKILTIIHEGKQLQISSPVTGIIKQVNQALMANPSALNADPYSTGWVYRLEPANWLREAKFMFMAGSFSEWLDEEFVRLKDFLAASANTDEVVYNHIVLQDGGELTDNVLATMEPKVWEDFQTHFLDVSR